MAFGKVRQDHNLGFNKLVQTAKKKAAIATSGSVLYGSVRGPLKKSNTNTSSGSVSKTISNSGPSKTAGLSGIASAGKSYNDQVQSAKTNANGKTIWPSISNLTNSAKNAVDPYLSMNLTGSEYEDVQNKNNMISVLMNRENNAFNAAQAEAQRNYETQMANTAHQREVQDLQAAGLNPVLSAGGTGAVTPNGAAAGASNFTGVDNSLINALAGLASSSIAANATMTAAATSAAAQRDAASMTAGAAVAAAAQSAQAAMYAADQNYNSNLISSFVNAGTGRYSADRAQENAFLKLLPWT